MLHLRLRPKRHTAAYEHLILESIDIIKLDDDIRIINYLLAANIQKRYKLRSESDPAF